MTELNLIHAKRALYYIPERWDRITFNTNNEITLEKDKKITTGPFEFTPTDYDYKIRNEKIDTAFSHFLNARDDKQFDRVVFNSFLDPNTGRIVIQVHGVVGKFSRPLHFAYYEKTPFPCEEWGNLKQT
jgi:hypothetical protein